MKSVKVRDYMTTNLVTFTPDTKLFTAIKTLLDRHISGAPVIDQEGHIVGLLSEWNCLQRILHGSYYEEVGGVVADYMSNGEDVHRIDPNADIVDVAEMMTTHHWRGPLMVEEKGKLVGILSCPDILKVIYDFDTRNL
ncbi:CBS domain-containing protein [Motiliproteus sediminis]|uniref:CBS domain-containing protein n=1 Tax=Motiliproteus sediminis TaxID=1468178 RepID=UPI001AF01562|nr:CBS domain-containing protein [Motiliproteus sediminis]